MLDLVQIRGASLGAPTTQGLTTMVELGLTCGCACYSFGRAREGGYAQQV